MIDLTVWGAVREGETSAAPALRRRFALYLLPSYLQDRSVVAELCDAQLDPSGALLGYLRDLSCDPEAVRQRLGYSTATTAPHQQTQQTVVTGKRCLRCNQAVYTDAPTIPCDGERTKVVPFSTHEPVR